MQIVIDIPDKDRRDIYWVKGKRVANLIGEYKVITVLLEEHGDLIDRKALLNRPYEKGGFVEWYDEIKHAPTIIEADKENK